MRRAVEVQNPSSTVLNHEETIQGLKHQRGNSEEVESHDDFAMVVQEGSPPLCLVLASVGF